jgi:inner membrane protein YhjD
MDILRPIRTFDRYQQRRKWLAIPMAVVRKFGNDQAGNLAALVAYYAFFSLFPLLLVMTTVLGFVLQHNSGAQHSVENSVLGKFPIIGQQIHLHSLTGSVSAVVIGLLISLFGGLGVTNAAQNAFDRLWAVPFKDRADFLRSRLRGLAVIGLLGVLFILATVIIGLINGIGGPGVKVAGVVVSLLVDFLIFLIAFRFLTSATVPTRRLWVGVTVAAVFWGVLQFFGGFYIKHVLRHASPVGAQFGIVIALIVFLHLGAQLTLYAAEINVVLARKLWPRSLLGPPDVPADQETLSALAKVEERHEEERVDVSFKQETPGSSPAAPPVGSGGGSQKS